jgi:hypothetical protein
MEGSKENQELQYMMVYVVLIYLAASLSAFLHLSGSCRRE